VFLLNKNKGAKNFKSDNFFCLRHYFGKRQLICTNPLAVFNKVRTNKSKYVWIRICVISCMLHLHYYADFLAVDSNRTTSQL
jgi:hypothetical protein